MNPEHGPPTTRISARDLLAVGAMLVATAAILHGMGQPWWCQQGDPTPWSWDVVSAHNSQHLVDPYTLTHVLHGIGFYAILWGLTGTRWSERQRFLATMLVEAAWEIFENTDFVIQRYREATISLDYFGDSVINSLGDIVACAAGYGMAMGLPVWGSAATFAGIELLLILWIRDSLLLNILMLVWPVEAIKTWQGG